MKKPCEAIVVRYVHDVRTGEFLNIGVILMSPAHDFVGARFINSWARVTAAFPDAEPVHLRRIARAVSRACDEWLAGTKQLEFMRVDQLETFLRSVIAFDDASIVFSPPISGITPDPVITLNELFFTYAGRHADVDPPPSRDEADIWRGFVERLATPSVVMHLQPYQMQSKHYSLSFEHTWLNGHRNAAQPISFDMLDARSIREKATQWTGRLKIIRPSDFNLRVFFLVGLPPGGASKFVRSAAVDAMAILEENLAGDVVMLTEDREGELAFKIAQDVKPHLEGPSPKND